MQRSVRKVLVIRKTSRLVYERQRTGYKKDELLIQKLSERGSDYHGLLQRHEKHESSVKEILRCLQNRGVAVITRKKELIKDEDVRWSDIVIAAGGDGNFLAAASRVPVSNHMVVGINTDPDRSEGYLCVTPSPSCSLEKIVNNILDGKFRSINRQRIRVTIAGEQLPMFALNEVFIGECDPSQTCYFELSCGEYPAEKLRNSGLLVYTGTGSTSWAYNANKLSPLQVEQVLSIAQNLGFTNNSTHLQEIAKQVTKSFNETIVFPFNEMKMGYVIREPIRRGVVDASSFKCAGYCNRLQVKSRSWDTQLIIDGQYTYKFPNGSKTEFSISPEDSLLTMCDSTVNRTN